ncbi:hypothetical protein [Yinghuangia soli]|uniref:Uncharacterized protein n=1 Tax=Yinghuangia soli TaxID=2908204 RepID=A0AA41U548_9ACTN|nr:hypothetical protein [Yinghuangia soli]MCF2533656.1 hypothetical protein [Yinghuangia soli]
MGLDPILDAWLIQPGQTQTAPAAAVQQPYETRLQSTLDPGGGSGQVVVTPDTLRASASALDAMRAEVGRDVQAAINATADERVNRVLELAEALQHVQERWGEKLKHLTGTMESQAGKLRDSANSWKQADTGQAKNF